VDDYFQKIFLNDPWEFLLCPEEPDPLDYETFEAYEEAIQRWGEICTQVLTKIPPHAEQLLDILPIQNFEMSDDFSLFKDDTNVLNNYDILQVKELFSRSNFWLNENYLPYKENQT